MLLMTTVVRSLFRTKEHLAQKKFICPLLDEKKVTVKTNKALEVVLLFCFSRENEKNNNSYCCYVHDVPAYDFKDQ